MLRGDGKVYILKTRNMKLPYDMTASLQNGKNKELFFNLIERSIVEDKNKLSERTVFFQTWRYNAQLHVPNKKHCFKISSDHVLQIPEKSSDHEEADTMLVAFVESAEVNGSNVMVRFPSGDMDILTGFTHFTPFFVYKQSTFDPRPENCLSFSKKSPQKLFINYLLDGLLISIV